MQTPYQQEDLASIIAHIEQYKYNHLTGNTDKRYILLWVSNTHSEFLSFSNGDGTDTIYGWKPIYKWQFDADIPETEYREHFRQMVSLASTGHAIQ